MADTKKTKQGISQFDLEGAQKGEVAAEKEIFNKKASSSLLAQYVRMYRTNQRQGTASAKTRAEVAGTTKKMYKQKGTGRARHGSYKAPIFKGGGVVGGPKPKEYRLFMNKKQRVQALFASLTLRYESGDVLNLVADAKELKTKLFSSFLKKMDLTGKKVLFVMPKGDGSKQILALRNLAGVSYTSVHSLNAYSVLNAAKVVFMGDTLKELETHFLKQNEN